MYVIVCARYMHMDVYVCMYIVQTHLFSFTSTLHFPSGQISLATPASLRSAQAALLQSCIIPVICLHVHTSHIHCHTSGFLPTYYIVGQTYDIVGQTYNII